MGGGGLRILGHKKWHVWRRENIERVDRDEREHEERIRHKHLHEQQMLLEKRSEILEINNNTSNSSINIVQSHINLFKIEAEEAKAAAYKEDVESHKKKDNLKQQHHIPWYAEPKAVYQAEAEIEQKKSRKERKRMRDIIEADPMKFIHPSSPPPIYIKNDHADSQEHIKIEEFNGNDEYQKKRKKRKKEKKEKKRGKTMQEMDTTLLMQQLRAERNDREQREHNRAKHLISEEDKQYYY